MKNEAHCFRKCLSHLGIPATFGPEGASGTVWGRTLAWEG